VQGLDLPVPADPLLQLGDGGLAEGQAGDGVAGGSLPSSAGQRPGPAGDPDGLRGVGERQPGGHGDDLQDTVLLPAVPRPRCRAAVGTAFHGRLAS